MNYEKIYEDLMVRAFDRKLDCYTEAHHILPRTMGGSNDPENLVELTAEEHFLAHKLLVKMFPGEHGLGLALRAMSMNLGGNRPNNKAFGWVRRRIAVALSESRKGVPRDRAMMEKIWAGNRGRMGSQEETSRKSVASKGVPKSAAHRAATAKALKGRPSPMKGRVHSEETKAKQRAAALGRKHSAETKEKLVAFAAGQTSQQRSARARKAWATKRAKIKEPPHE
jgi:hypothetical protein